MPSFLILRLGMGIATAPLYPATGKMNAEWMAPEQRGRAQGVVNAGAGLGCAVAPVLFHCMIGGFGWRLSFVLVGAATAVSGLIWLVLTRARSSRITAEADATKAPTPRKSLFGNRSLMWLTLGDFMVCYFEYIFFY
ncbi:MAG: MFS transporter [Bryobacteraceae bacterium]